MAASLTNHKLPTRIRRLLLQWHVTERCNLRCAHCYQGGQSAAELGFDACLAVLAQFERLLVRLHTGTELCGHITITGGEPLVRRDLLALLRRVAARSDRYRFAILTNGTLIDPSLASDIARLRPTYVQVSIEGQQETHDRIRGVGTFAMATRAIRHLVRQGVRTMLSFTAHRGNYREFPQVARLGRNLGVARVWADRLIPCGSGADLGDLVLTPSETRSFFQLMAGVRGGKIRRKFVRTEVAMHRALQFLVGKGCPYRCSAGRSLITLLPNGDLLPCRRLPLAVGNVMNVEMANLFFDSDLLRQLRDEDQISTGCETCSYQRLCGGGLRCLAYAVTGSWQVADPGCWLAVRPEDGVGKSVLLQS